MKDTQIPIKDENDGVDVVELLHACDDLVDVMLIVSLGIVEPRRVDAHKEALVLVAQPPVLLHLCMQTNHHTKPLLN
jgi:hypothetical protein